MWFVKPLTFFVCCLNVFSNRADEKVQNVMEESEINNSLLENIVLYGVISEIFTTYNSNISATCENDLKHILKSINKQDMWAVKVVDASGTYESSFVWGQNAWLGSKSQCNYLNNPPKFTVSPDIPKLMDKHLISTTSPIEMEFKMIFLIITSPLKVDPIIQLRTSNTHRLGLCLPKTCTNHEIEFLSQTFFAKRKLNFQKLYNATMDVINVRNMDKQNYLNRSEFSRILIIICLITALVIVFSFVSKCVENTNLDEVKRFFRCFSIYDNVAAMYDTGSSPNAINSINGFRTIICMWVLLIHCGYYSMYAYDNLPVLMNSLERIELQPVLAIVFYVDSFFVLSALLLVYNFLKDERTLKEIKDSNYIENVKLFTKKIIHRYIRLTPAFLFTIGVSHLLNIYIQESSSFYIDDTFDIYCTRGSWWNSVFYIHNLFRVKDMCLSWSWYLACDMQFYIIILFVLFVHARNRILARSLLITLFAVITAAGIYSNVEMNLLPRLDSIFHHLDEFYIEPWNRMHPYLAGVTIGYAMFQSKNKNFPNNLSNSSSSKGFEILVQRDAIITVTYWIGAFTTIYISLFVTSLKEMENLNLALGLSFGRYFMGLFVGSIIFMCHIGYGGIVNKVLSSRLFVHLNKTTYIMYLIHPTLILFFNSNQESNLHFDVPGLVTTVAGIMLLSYFCAVLISPIFEIPFQKLSDEYVMRKSKVKK